MTYINIRNASLTIEELLSFLEDQKQEFIFNDKIKAASQLDDNEKIDLLNKSLDSLKLRKAKNISIHEANYYAYLINNKFSKEQ